MPIVHVFQLTTSLRKSELQGLYQDVRPLGYEVINTRQLLSEGILEAT